MKFWMSDDAICHPNIIHNPTPRLWIFVFVLGGGCFVCLFVFEAVGLCLCDQTHQRAWKLCFFKMMRRESGQRAILEVGCSLCAVFYWLKQIITLNFDWVSKVHIWISWAYSCCQLGCTHKNRICSVFLWYTWDSCWCCVSVKLEEMQYFYQGQSDKVCSFLLCIFGILVTHHERDWTWLRWDHKHRRGYDREDQGDGAILI